MIAAIGGTALVAVGLMGQVHFPATGITTQGKAALLAIDNVSLPLKRNLCYYMTRPMVRREPVLAPRRGDPNAPDNLATHFYGAVLRDEGRFRMWYYPCSTSGTPPTPKPGPICYAVSEDGIHWVRPSLGQFEFNGSRENNGLDLPAAPPRNRIFGAGVIRDDDDPDPARRYKMMYETDLIQNLELSSFRTAVSPDGIHWTASPDAVVQSFAEPSSFYKHNGLYIVNAQEWGIGEGGRHLGRTATAWISPDFNDWVQESAESFTLPDPLQTRQLQVHLGVGAVSLGNVCIGLYCIWRDDAEFSKISGDFGLVVSNDGLFFREPVKGYVWLPSKDSPATPVPGRDYPTVLCQANGIINVGDETRIYHGRWRNVGWPLPEGREEDYYAEVALATIPRDRWGALGLYPEQVAASARRDTSTGSVWSCPVTLPEGGCGLTLNADGAEGMRVEVADERFAPIEDYSGKMSGVPQAVGGFDVHVAWPKADLAGLAGRTVRFRIQVKKVGDADPRLYCVYLIPAMNPTSEQSPAG